MHADAASPQDVENVEKVAPLERSEDDPRDSATPSFQGSLVFTLEELLPVLPAMGIMRPRSAFILAATAISLFSVWFVVDPETVKQNLLFVIPLSILPFFFAYVGHSVVNQLLGQRLSFRVDPRGLRTSGPNGDESYDWDTFTAFGENASAFLLYRKRKVAHLLPRRAFDKHDVSGVRALLEASLKKRKAPVRWRRNLFWAIAIIATVVVWLVRSH